MKRKVMCVIFAALFTAQATAHEKRGIFDALFWNAHPRSSNCQCGSSGNDREVGP